LPISPTIPVPAIAINNQEQMINKATTPSTKGPDVANLFKTNPTPIAIASTLIDPKEVGHNIYILAHQLSRHNEELAALLNPDSIKDEESVTKTALDYYKRHTAMIEVRSH
jgi:hypothetical protein